MRNGNLIELRDISKMSFICLKISDFDLKSMFELKLTRGVLKNLKYSKRIPNKKFTRR